MSTFKNVLDMSWSKWIFESHVLELNGSLESEALNAVGKISDLGNSVNNFEDGSTRHLSFDHSLIVRV